MSLVIATGSNLGNSLEHLKNAKISLCQHFELVAESRIYTSKAVDYLNQPDFYNQVLEFKVPPFDRYKAFEIMNQIEQKLGRTRDILRGPRTIDIDMLFWGKTIDQSEQLTLPHPRWLQRSFVVRPLKELPFFKVIEKSYNIPDNFLIEATPL